VKGLFLFYTGVRLVFWLYVKAEYVPKAPPSIFTGRLAATHIMDDYCCQLPVNDDHLYSDPQYSCDQYIQA
jgi:hypothetical protein